MFCHICFKTWLIEPDSDEIWYLSGNNTRNSSRDEIANVNFPYDDIVGLYTHSVPAQA